MNILKSEAFYKSLDIYLFLLTLLFKNLSSWFDAEGSRRLRARRIAEGRNPEPSEVENYLIIITEYS
jgi:hypothetical protein